MPTHAAILEPAGSSTPPHQDLHALRSLMLRLLRSPSDEDRRGAAAVICGMPEPAGALLAFVKLCAWEGGEYGAGIAADLVSDAGELGNDAVEAFIEEDGSAWPSLGWSGCRPQSIVWRILLEGTLALAAVRQVFAVPNREMKLAAVEALRGAADPEARAELQAMEHEAGDDHVRAAIREALLDMEGGDS